MQSRPLPAHSAPLRRGALALVHAAPRPSTMRDRWVLRLRSVGLVVSALAGTVGIGVVVERHYPVENWLFWSYASYLGLAAGWSLACLSAGHVALTRVCGRTLPLREHVAMSFAMGLLVFFFGMFVTGLLGLYGPALFVAWPLVLLASGAPSLFRYSIRFRRAARGVGRLWWPRRAPEEIAAMLFGLLGIVLVYFVILTPENVAYDARWYHLSIAEHYAAQGGVRAFPEGWYQGSLPHLASFVYTWAFLLPRSDLFARVELAAHLEFAIFLWTLFSIPVLVRWAAPRSRARFAWAAVFLFSGIFLYDSTLSAAADHVAGFWGVPIFLAFRRAYGTFRSRDLALLGAMLAGAILTKYQAMSLLAFPIAAIFFRAAVLAAKSRGRVAELGKVGAGLASAMGAGLLCTSPHWLKNWVWYGDPIYPLLHAHLRLHPWTVDAGNLVESFFEGVQMWRPHGTTSEMLQETLRATLTFAIEPHDWPSFHGNMPVFGFLFTATLPLLPFLSRAGRLWVLYAAGHLGVFVWYWTSHQDRYLQALMPILAAATAATILRAWQSGVGPRIAIACLVGTQIVWGGDVYFIPSHLNPTPPAKLAYELLSTGYRKDISTRAQVFGDWSPIGQSLPKNAKVLVHEIQPHLGLQRMSVADGQAWQGGISYGRIASPKALYEKLRGYGVTHLVWANGRSDDMDSLAGDIVFWEFATKYTVSAKAYGGRTLAALPAVPPPDRRWLDENVAIIACPSWYPAGLYRVGDVTQPMYGEKPPFARARRPLDPTHWNRFLPEASFVAFDPQCQKEPPRKLRDSFTLVTNRHTLQVWARK